MTLGEEAARSVQGAWGLLRRDPAAPTAFNATIDGFWRSFFAAVLLFPLVLAYLAMVEPVGEGPRPASSTRWIVNILAYVIGWTGWPLIAFYLTRAMGCGDRLLGYLVAYNWSQLITGPFIIGIAVLGRIAFAQTDAALIGLIAHAGVLIYEYLIARQMLAIPAARAALVVMTSLIFTLILRDAANFALKLATPEAT